MILKMFVGVMPSPSDREMAAKFIKNGFKHED